MDSELSKEFIIKSKALDDLQIFIENIMKNTIITVRILSKVVTLSSFGISKEITMVKRSSIGTLILRNQAITETETIKRNSEARIGSSLIPQGV